jgi:hypothetical protein
MTFGDLNLIAAFRYCELSFDDCERKRFIDDIYLHGWDGRTSLSIGEAHYFLRRASPLKYQQAMHAHCLMMNEDTQ